MGTGARLTAGAHTWGGRLLFGSATGALTGGGYDAATQGLSIGTGIQEEYSFTQTGQATAFGALFGAGAAGGGHILHRAQERGRPPALLERPRQDSGTQIVGENPRGPGVEVPVSTGGLATGNASRPGGYLTGDVDRHGLLSPQTNRAPGNTNTRNDNFVQSHHPIQDRWAQENIQGYRRNDAPAILLESSSGAPHARINSAQQARRRELKQNEGGPWNTSIEQEFSVGYRQMIDAGVPEDQARKAIIDSYKYFDFLEAFK